MAADEWIRFKKPDINCTVLLLETSAANVPFLERWNKTRRLTWVTIVHRGVALEYGDRLVGEKKILIKQKLTNVHHASGSCTALHCSHGTRKIKWQSNAVRPIFKTHSTSELHSSNYIDYAHRVPPSIYWNDPWPVFFFNGSDVNVVRETTKIGVSVYATACLRERCPGTDPPPKYYFFLWPFFTNKLLIVAHR